MKVGVISDIHGNLTALEAVLEELSQEGVNTVLCAGDIVGSFGWSNKVCSLLRLTTDNIVFGNHDANVMPRFEESGKLSSVEHDIVTEHLHTSTLDWLCDLPEKKIGLLGGVKTTLVHAHPDREPHHGFPAQNHLSPERYAKQQSNMDHGVVIHGHTHEQHSLDLSKFDGLKGQILNPGSVGVPLEKPAEYAIIEYPNLNVDLRTVEYDIERNIARLKELGLERWRQYV